MFDCGEGTQHRFKASVHTSIKNLKKIFITHMHGDHTFGLGGMLASLLIADPTHEPIELYGPKGIARYVYSTLYDTHTLIPKQKLKIFEFSKDGSKSFDMKDNISVKVLNEYDQCKM